MASISRDQIATAISGVAGLTRAKSERIVREFERTVSDPVAQRLASLSMREIVSKKNPYLYRASGIASCEDIVRRAYQDYVSASLEGDFGKFFESVARIVSGGRKPALGGEVDLEIEINHQQRVVYAIKSGPKGFNSSSYATAKRDLDSVERRLRQDGVATTKKIAFAYGRKLTTFRDGIERMASKRFWAEISGDEDFYMKLLLVCGLLAPLYVVDIQGPYQALLVEAHELFCEAGEVNWDSLITLVSG